MRGELDVQSFVQDVEIHKNDLTGRADIVRLATHAHAHLISDPAELELASRARGQGQMILIEYTHTGVR